MNLCACNQPLDFHGSLFKREATRHSGDAADERWGGVSPPAARQTRPPAARASSPSARSSRQRASLSPAPADAAPRETTPADSRRLDASGHVNISGEGMAAGRDK